MNCDPRLLNLSYSGRLLLHECPRRFQLQKLNVTPTTEETLNASITLSFGQIVGLGVQMCLQDCSEDQIIFAMYLEYKPDLWAEDTKQQKSFWLAVSAVQQFISLRENGFLDDWELVTYGDKPAVELSFRIHLPDNFKYRGFVDAVLRNKIDGRVMVLECKTTSAVNLNAATYKNSSQGVGYSVVLDYLFDDLSSYEVLYLVYLTKAKQWEQLPFTKYFLSRALWLQELLLDTQIIATYEKLGVYPMYGESCFSFYRECEFFQNCTMSTNLLTRQMTDAELEQYNEREGEGKYQLEVTFQSLLESQFKQAPDAL